jgi:hypothetical protein
MIWRDVGLLVLVFAAYTVTVAILIWLAGGG